MKYAIPSIIILALGLISLSFFKTNDIKPADLELPKVSAEEICKQFIDYILDGKCDEALQYCDDKAKEKLKAEMKENCSVLSPNIYVNDYDIRTDTISAVGAVFTRSREYDPNEPNRFYFVWMSNINGEWRIKDYFYINDQHTDHGYTEEGVEEAACEEAACEGGECEEAACEEAEEACEGGCGTGDYWEEDYY